MFPTLVTNLWKERIFVIDIKYIFMKVLPYTWLLYRAGLENDDDMWGINPLTRIAVRAHPSYCSLCTAIHSTVALWGQKESEASRFETPLPLK